MVVEVAWRGHLRRASFDNPPAAPDESATGHSHEKAA
jgi:hypothetical protein